ncbi:MAG: BMP family ABC transporter substrate-binding protein [Anaerolineae bacterium]|nr:BMP family ABC transporter substrate-binding protein [Anaerolineae bacterium]
MVNRKHLFWIIALVLIVPVLVSCGQAAPAEEEAAYQIPDIEEGMFNVAFVYIGPHDDGGWSQSHDVGRQYVQDNVDGVHTAYVEIVAEGADSEQVIRSLARKGFDLIFTTSFGYMDPTETVAGEFPDIDFVHVSGYKANGTNFGNVMGAMEDMKYLAGMLAGSRAKLDGNPRIGYMATFPIPEELRLGNAFALGMKVTCPECTMDVRWINTWHDPVIEKEAAASLFDAGVQVVFTGADTPASADVAEEKGKWGITYDYYGSCKSDACLTAPYWNWGPIYADITERSMAGEYVGGWEYFDAETGGLGLYGFMEGEEPMPGVADLPAEDVQLVKDTLAAMLAGDFDRFDVFSGPITDNQGNEIIAAGKSFVQADLDQFPPGAEGLECEYCMYWWAEGVTAELPELE